MVKAPSQTQEIDVTRVHSSDTNISLRIAGR